MISVTGRATRVLDAGDGPALACSPGIASFVWDWAPVAQCLSATHRVIVVERPADERLGTGHLDAERLDVEHPGAAARPDAAHPDLERADADQPEATAGAPTMLEDDAAHLLNALDALGVTGPVTFVGHSGLSWRKPRRAWPRSGPRPSSCSTGHSPRTAPPSPRRLDRADAHDSWRQPCEAARPSLLGGSAAPRFARWRCPRVVHSRDRSPACATRWRRSACSRPVFTNCRHIRPAFVSCMRCARRHR